MEVVDKKIEDLIPAEYNPRWMSEEQFEQLKASIKRFDAIEPVVVNMSEGRRNIIISGHQRIRAAKALNMSTFPCVEVDLSRDQERELNIRMNKNTGDWDWGDLANHFSGEELYYWGFTDEELFGDTEFDPLVDPDIDDHEVSDDEIEKRAKELAEKMVKESEHRDVICPECGNEFSINE